MGADAEMKDVYDEIFKNMSFNAMFLLIEAVFMRARTDYMFNIDGKSRDAELFFRSAWAQTLSLSMFDPDDVLKQMDKEVESGRRQADINPLRDQW